MTIPRLAKAIALVTAVALSMCAAAPAQRTVRIPAGSYQPLYGTEVVPVRSFRMDANPVTRGEYFAWSRGAAPTGVDARRPMTGVSWAEAGAFCAARGGRLPTLVEWEYVAAAAMPGDRLAMYSSRSATPATVDHGTVNALGVRGLHDLVWEWVGDPNERLAALHHAAHDHGKPGDPDMSCAGAAIGAGNTEDYPAFLRGAIRSGLTETTRLPTLGFRCAA